MRRNLVRLACILAALQAGPARAFDPSMDRAGPLTLRLEGPKEVTQTGVPLPVRVVLENAGETPLAGRVALRGIDGWAVQPAGAVNFRVGGKAAVRQEFTVRAASGAYDALYPLHAEATFLDGDISARAHAVLIVPVQLDRAPRTPTAPEWRPFKVAREGRLSLLGLPASRAVVAVAGRPPRVRPPGWKGRDEATSATFGVQEQTLGGARREVIAIHPPWRDGQVGSGLVEFPLALPERGPIRLRFENAVTPEGRGDGVTFRVRVAPLDAPEGTLGEVALQRQSVAKRWGDAAEADLDRYAGRTVRLQLESHPGPANNTSFDQSYWAEPTLVTGAPTRSLAFPPAGDAGSVSLGTIRLGGGSTEVRVWPGRRGLLDAAVGFTGGAGPVFFRGFEVRVLGRRIDDAGSSIQLASVEAAKEGAVYRVRHHFEGPEGSFDLVGRLSVAGGALRARIQLENTPAPRPWKVVALEDVALGPWSRKARRVYAGHGNVVRDPSGYSLDFDGHRLATSFVGFDFEGGTSIVQGVDAPPTRLEVQPDALHYSLHAAPALTFTLIPSANAFDAVKVWRDVNGLRPSRGVARAAGRFVFDLWGGRYADAASALRRSFRYGLGDSLVIWHDWQRWGYDYRLPEIYPPSPRWGTAEELKGLVDACRSSGTLFALHDNYIDFYPDAEGFSYAQNIAFDGEGRPVRAWLNTGRGAQSYRFRADRVEPFLAGNIKKVRDGLAPSAYFLDVWSSIRPYEYWTADGRFFDRAFTRDAWGKLFARIRDDLGGDAPQISESGHDQLIGWLDGAQTNHLRVTRPGQTPGKTSWAWPCGDAERTPWFDAAHHDRFVLHGAGYRGRYESGLDPRLHGIDSDDYLATEMLTGHPVMVAAPFGAEVVARHWLTNDVMRGLALRRIESVAFVGDDLHRQHVRWSGGGEVRVNRGETDWEVAGRVLPPYGFLARVPLAKGVAEASLTRRDGLIVEEARAPEQIYVNARGLSGPPRIRPSVTAARLDGGRRFTLAVRWQADDPIPEGFRPFLHFCDPSGEVVFQAAQAPGAVRDPATKTIRTQAGGTLPASAAPGTSFELLAGLFNPKTGTRLALPGPDDGTSRVRLGKLRVEGRGGTPTGLTWTPVRPAPDPILARLNPQAKTVDFGPLATSAGVRLTRDGLALLVTPLPSDKGVAFDVRLRLKSLPWPVAPTTRAVAVAEDGRVLAREAVRRTVEEVVLTCRPGVFQYRLVAE